MVGKFRQIFRVPEVLHNICNMCGRDLPDMSALAFGLVHTYQQIPPAHVTYTTYIRIYIHCIYILYI